MAPATGGRPGELFREEGRIIPESVREPVGWLGRRFPHVFYGWFVTAGTGAVSFVSVGIGFYGQTFLFDGLRSTHGWPVASLAGASSLFFVVSALASPLVGRRMERDGPRRCIVLGACLLAGSLVAVAWLDHPWQLYLVYPGMALGFSLSSAIPSGALIARWFVALRARAMAFSQTGVSLGGMLVVPLATWLMIVAGLRTAMVVLAGLVLAIAIPVSLWVLRSSPADCGLEPDGGRQPDAQGNRLSLAGQLRVWETREVLRAPSFWLLCIAFSGIMFAQVGVLVHELALLGERMDLASAAVAFGLTPLGSALARIAVGLVADLVDRRRLAVGLFAVQALALYAFGWAPDTPSLFAVSFLFGCTIGNIFMLQSLLVGEFFGMVSFGSVFGLLQFVTQLASGLGPFGLALLVEHYGGYRGALGVLAGIALVAALVLSVASPPRRPEATP
ncbi:MAG: MFS transporter [Myxococcales bacterium]|nr:MFS transporter [Myxococcales bacterium]